jgi:two-component system alkaline phosphatase synthesis response regulator PhoP
MTGDQKIVLVIEDEEETADMLAEMLKVSGYAVVSSDHSQNAIEIIKEQPLNAIVLDIMLPGISGLEVLRFVRQTPQFTEIPVVVVSAKALPKDIKAGFEAGATAYLTKPVSYNDLKQAVEKAV